MITLAEGKQVLGVMSKFSIVGLIPFKINVEKGKLSEPSRTQRGIWYVSLLFRAAYITQQLYQMRSIYLLNVNCERASALHVGFAFATQLIFMLEAYLSAVETGPFVLVFNELFGKRESYRSPWKSMKSDDLIVRYMLPIIATLTPVMATCTILIIPKIILRPIDLPFVQEFNNYAALNCACLIIDVYYFSCVIIQLHFQVFYLLITCSKIVQDLQDAKGTKRYPCILVEKRIFRKARQVQLYCSLANLINSWITYTIKLVSLSCTISFLYIVITQFSANIGFSLMFLYASFLTITCYGYICYFANPVADQMHQLRRCLTSRTWVVANQKHRLELIASIKSLKVEHIRVGAFHALERESILMFLDFVIVQLVSLLVVHTT